jgi:hypothetical protein
VPADIQALAAKLDAMASGGAFGKAPTRTVLTSGSDAFTTPAGARALLVECYGGGGGCAGSANPAAGQCVSGGSGGGGAYAASLIQNPAATYNYTVGAAGAAGTNAPTAGGNGGTTNFGPVTAAGGGGGSVNAPVTAPAAIPAGGGGTLAGSVGDVTSQGGFVEPGIAVSASLLLGTFGQRGHGPLGGDPGARRVATPSVGAAGGQTPGGGATGGAFGTGGGAGAGFAGGAGLIVVTAYF